MASDSIPRSGAASLKRAKQQPRRKPISAPDSPLASRKQAGHTQMQAADMLGVPYRTYQDWERGVSRMPAYALRLYRHLAGLERIPYRAAR